MIFLEKLIQIQALNFSLKEGIKAKSVFYEQFPVNLQKGYIFPVNDLADSRKFRNLIQI